MYNYLDAPPPPSQFHRRPWSPYDPLPSAVGSNNNSRDTFTRLQLQHYQQQQQRLDEDYYPLPEDQFPRLPQPSRMRREASDVSVEALDLADYARTLRSRQAEDPYPPFSTPESPTSRQRSRNNTSYPQPPSSFPDSVPSLVSRGPTLSSATVTTSNTNRSAQSRSRRPRRPFSLPSSPYGSTPHVVQPPEQPEQEIDISQFPAWSRGWYQSQQQHRHFNLPNAYNDGINTHEDDFPIDPVASGSRSMSIPATRPKPLSPFDPGYIHPESYPNGYAYNPYTDSYPSYSAPSYSNHGDTRDLLPWSNDPPEYKNPPIDPQLKNERMRMLEHEFGPNAKGSGKGWGGGGVKDDGLMRDDDGKPLIGTPDGRGGLVTQGPKKRTAIRILQIALAVGSGVPIIYASIAIKPQTPPPPAGKPPIYILYILSSFTLLLLFYLFFIRPCVSRSSLPSSFSNPGMQGMMVLPVSGARDKKGNPGKGGMGVGKGKKGKKGGMMGSGDVQVNLIVDPTAFALPGEEDTSSSDEEYDDGGMPGAFLPPTNGKGRDKTKRKRQKRKGLLAGLKLEEEWMRARKWAKRMAAVDVIGFLLWGTAFGFVLAGKRCPSGGFNGWCNAYNVSTAAACLLCIAFGITVFFDVKDLHASKASPRTRV